MLAQAVLLLQYLLVLVIGWMIASGWLVGREEQICHRQGSEDGIEDVVAPRARSRMVG